MSQKLTYEELVASSAEMGRGMMRLAREAVDKDAEIERLRAENEEMRTHLVEIEIHGASWGVDGCTRHAWLGLQTAREQVGTDTLSQLNRYEVQALDEQQAASRWCIHSSPTLCKFPACECERRS